MHTESAIPTLTWLTTREREVAGLAARGLTKREIADQLYLSIRTVGNHLNHIYGKLGLSRREELAAALSLHPDHLVGFGREVAAEGRDAHHS